VPESRFFLSGQTYAPLNHSQPFLGDPFLNCVPRREHCLMIDPAWWSKFLRWASATTAVIVVVIADCTYYLPLFKNSRSRNPGSRREVAAGGILLLSVSCTGRFMNHIPFGNIVCRSIAIACMMTTTRGVRRIFSPFQDSPCSLLLLLSKKIPTNRPSPADTLRVPTCCRWGSCRELRFAEHAPRSQSHLPTLANACLTYSFPTTDLQ
jgi:hypothetical protein